MRYRINLARKLRKGHAKSEEILWKLLRNRNFSGYKFRRQKPFGRYIADFVCLEKKIIIEVDGSVHDEMKEYDEQRDEYLKSAGFKVVRILSEVVERDIDAVMELLKEVFV